MKHDIQRIQSRCDAKPDIGEAAADGMQKNLPPDGIGWRNALRLLCGIPHETRPGRRRSTGSGVLSENHLSPVRRPRLCEDFPPELRSAPP